MQVAVVVGNPKVDSRTLKAAVTVAERIAGRPPATVVDLATLGPRLLTWGDEEVAAANAAVGEAAVVVVASPTYKGAYTGLLKVYLDQLPAGALTGKVALPVMLGAGPHHAMAPELVLRPVLVELGASCPVRGLYLLDSTWDDPAALDGWLADAQRALGSSQAPR